MTKETAKELSILKWKYIVKNNGSDDGLTIAYPILNQLYNNCGYCEYYMHTNLISKGGLCVGCPLDGYAKSRKEGHDDRLGCRHSAHPFLRWTRYHTKASAEKVLEMIKNT